MQSTLCVWRNTSTIWQPGGFLREKQKMYVFVVLGDIFDFDGPIRLCMPRASMLLRSWQMIRALYSPETYTTHPECSPCLHEHLSKMQDWKHVFARKTHTFFTRENPIFVKLYLRVKKLSGAAQVLKRVHRCVEKRFKLLAERRSRFNNLPWVCQNSLATVLFTGRGGSVDATFFQKS